MFAPGDEIRPASVLRQVLRDWADTYDAEPYSLPFGPDAPGDVPVVMLASADQTQRINVARTRVDIVWSRGEGGAEPELQSILSDFAGRLGAISAENTVPVGRLGAVVTRVAEVLEPGLALARQFCRDRWLSGPLNRPEGFELHAHFL